MTDQELLQAIRTITREETAQLIQESEVRMTQKIQDSEERMTQKIQDSEERMTQKIQDSEERMTQKIQESEERMTQKILDSEERMTQKIKESEVQTMKNVAVLMDADFGPKFNLLGEQIDLILERLPDPEEMQVMDHRVSALELSVKRLNKEVKELKAANQ